MILCNTLTYNSFTESFPGAGSSISASLSFRNSGDRGCLGLVDQTPWRVFTMWPLMVSSADGQYMVALL